MRLFFVSGVVPVKITSFTASKTGDKKTLLNWSTASEQNNRGFAIERRKDSTAWSSIGFINSKGVNGSSITTLHYIFEDNAPLATVNYYRLKHMNTDGSYENSNIRVLNFSAAINIKLYPNRLQNG
ncbi:MAG: hypothetical protein EOP53_11860 [Sphingobacteriales bacterium]|nr:MAG: hypothetical protein EOP53_11860 [Sphingobacteriales bacterium]